MTTGDWDEVPVHKCKSKVKNKTNNNNNTTTTNNNNNNKIIKYGKSTAKY